MATVDKGLNKKRRVYLDILRLIAIFFVLYAHTDRSAIHHYFVEGSQGSYWLALFLQQVTYINTTLFFAISGALLLDKQESFKEILSKRVLKYVIVIILFDFVQYCYNYYNNPEIGFDLGIIFKRMYATSMITQYWFLYAYLAFLLLLPFIRILVKNMTKLHFRYLIIGFIIINGILPLLEVLWENDRFVLEIPFFANIIIYPLLGYYIEKMWYEAHYSKEGSKEADSKETTSNKTQGEKIPRWLRVTLVNLTAVLALSLNVWYTYAKMQEQAYYLAAEGLTVILVMTIYCDVRFICEGMKDSWFTKLLGVAGKGTFVVYLLEPELREGFQFIYDSLYLKISWLPATVLWLGAAIVTGIVISFVYEVIKKAVLALPGLIKHRE